MQQGSPRPPHLHPAGAPSDLSPFDAFMAFANPGRGPTTPKGPGPIDYLAQAQATPRPAPPMRSPGAAAGASGAHVLVLDVDGVTEDNDENTAASDKNDDTPMSDAPEGGSANNDMHADVDGPATFASEAVVASSSPSPSPAPVTSPAPGPAQTSPPAAAQTSPTPSMAASPSPSPAATAPANDGKDTDMAPDAQSNQVLGLDADSSMAGQTSTHAASVPARNVATSGCVTASATSVEGMDMAPPSVARTPAHAR